MGYQASAGLEPVEFDHDHHPMGRERRLVGPRFPATGRLAGSWGGVPMIVISPYAKRGYVSHVQMDHVSVLRFIQWNWSLAPE